MLVALVAVPRTSAAYWLAERDPCYSRPRALLLPSAGAPTRSAPRHAGGHLARRERRGHRRAPWRCVSRLLRQRFLSRRSTPPRALRRLCERRHRPRPLELRSRHALGARAPAADRRRNSPGREPAGGGVLG